MPQSPPASSRADSRRDAKAAPGSVRPGIRMNVTLHTASWFALCCVMGYAGAVQANGAAYLLAFLTGTLGLMSYIYARANLRGLDVQVGAVPVRHAGVEALPVELRASTGHPPCGVEVFLVGSGKPVFVEQVPAGRPVHLQLRLPSEGGTSAKLLFRSSYPLGLLQAQRVVEVELERPAVPPASGHLPLPAPTSAVAAGENRGSSPGKISREGDDFAGVREWHPGDSPRHVDWRAVARGRPLMVKTWALQTGECIAMDWDDLPLPEAERPGQLVRWIQMCEQQGLAYSLKVPGVEIPAGQGEGHARLCLDAVAKLHAGGLAGSDSKASVRLPAGHEHKTEVQRGPLIWLGAVLLVAALPMFELVSWPVVFFLALCVVARSCLRSPLRQRWIPLLAVAAGIGLAYLQVGNLMTMEAGIAALIVLAGGKLLESRSPHDFQVISMIGWFFCLCGLLTDQSIVRSLLMFSCYAAVTSCMVRFRRGVPGIKVPAFQTARLLAQALPLVLLLFFFFPRVSLDYLARLGVGRTAVTGVTNSLDPGKVLQLTRSTQTAFRVEFPDGNLPGVQDRYWRCVVLWQCHGLSWERGPAYSALPADARQGDIHQVITLEPHGQFWLPSLDYPVLGTSGRSAYVLSSERLLHAHDVVRKMTQIHVYSRPGVAWAPLSDFQRADALSVPRNLSPALKELAAQWREAGGNDDARVVQAGLNYLRTQGFQYTLEPGSYMGENALEDFVLRRRAGFCEHFSAAFATLMRAAGVPSRVVIGYLGGELSMSETHLIVRQSDAHSWTEVWLPASGWTRIDPTAALAPGRVNSNLQNFLSGADQLAAEADSLLGWSTQKARLLWDQLNYQWYKVIINFDDDTQSGWLSLLGLDNVNRGHLLGVSVLGGLLVLAVLTFWLRRPARGSDPWQRAWEKMCRRVEFLGEPARRSSEGPLAYADRVNRREVQELAREYAVARYGQGSGSIRAFKRKVRELRWN